MERQTSAFSIFLMVIIGVFVANMLTLTSMIVWSKYETEAAIRLMTEVTNNIAQNTQRVISQNRVESERLRKERVARAGQLSSIRTRNDQVCNYWRGEYSKEGSLYNKSWMNESCSRSAND